MLRQIVRCLAALSVLVVVGSMIGRTATIVVGTWSPWATIERNAKPIKASGPPLLPLELDEHNTWVAPASPESATAPDEELEPADETQPKTPCPKQTCLPDDSGTPATAGGVQPGDVLSLEGHDS